MKRILSVLFLFTVIININSENLKTDYVSRVATIHITVDEINDADSMVNSFIKKYNLKVETLNKDGFNKSNNYTLLTKQNTFDEIVAEINNLGIVTLHKIETKNNINLLRVLEYDLDHLESQAAHYQKELEKLNLDKNEEYYHKLWDSERSFSSAIYEKNKTRMELLNEVEYHKIILKITEKNVQELNRPDEFSEFINMPGVETHFFYIENPESDTSADAYLGGSLRYMFTRGRYYFTVGALKPIINGDSSVLTQANDILIYGIGKDFYPRYLGQGRRRFFNLYSGFLVGGMILTSEDNIYHLFTVEPHIGVEIFKNQYFIIDTRFGYLIPLEQDKIKILRGFNHSLSLNIVF